MKKDTFGRREQADVFIRNRNTSIIIFVIIVLFSLLFYRSLSRQAVYVQPTQDEVEITSRSGDSVTVSYDSLVAVSLKSADSVEAGTATESGHETRSYASGVWINDDYGEYNLYVLKKISDVIVLEGTDTVTVFNYESTETTDALYNALGALIMEQTSGVVTFNPEVENS